MNRIKTILRSNSFILVILLIAILIFFGLLNNRFFLPQNVVQYLNSGIVLGFLTFGLSATIITGNFDFSIGAMCGFGTVIIARFMMMDIPIVLSLFLAFCILVIFGCINGFLAGYMQIPGMLATLGTSSLYYGIGLVLTGGQAISVIGLENSDTYTFFGKSDLGTLPFGMMLLLLVFIVSAILLNRSKWGRRLYLTGISYKAARFSGINTKWIVLTAHVYSAMMCFLGALILGSRMASGRADVGQPYVLEAVSAAVFGGISIKGGEGTITGAILGVLIFSLLTSGFTMINMSQYYRQIVTGILLIVVLVIRNYGEILNHD
ncbi:MAG: ABC transporter permease [Treponema sp.]|jgi:ribose/xylose/arabinose/galactoside ABC-type transport system permease subunit|nr:ABC transporter permease [Treponema sp.]